MAEKNLDLVSQLTQDEKAVKKMKKKVMKKAVKKMKKIVMKKAVKKIVMKRMKTKKKVMLKTTILKSNKFLEQKGNLL